MRFLVLKKCLIFRFLSFLKFLLVLCGVILSQKRSPQEKFKNIAPQNHFLWRRCSLWGPSDFLSNLFFFFSPPPSFCAGVVIYLLFYFSLTCKRYKITLYSSDRKNSFSARFGPFWPVLARFGPFFFTRFNLKIIYI